MLTKEVVKEYSSRKCNRLAFLQLDEKRLLSFWTKLVESKKNITDFLDDDEVEEISVFDYFRTYPEALKKAKEIYQENFENDVVTKFIKENENLQEVSVLSMRYFALSYTNVKRADTPTGGLDEPSLENQNQIEANTQKLLQDKSVDVILEGQITIDGIRARFDALIRKGDSFILCEVKGSNSIFKKESAKNQSIKQPYLYDMAFQYAVYKKAKLPLAGLYFLRINPLFRMHTPCYPLEDSDVLNFFEMVGTINLDDSVYPLKQYYDEKLYAVKENFDVDYYIDLILDLQKHSEPQPIMKYSCRQNGVCPLLGDCFPNVDASSSIKLTCNMAAGGYYKTLMQIIDEERIKLIKDIPDDIVDKSYPKTKVMAKTGVEKRNVCRMQIDFAKQEYSKKHILEVNKLKELLNQDYSVFPLIFFDFESFMYPVPLVDSATPWTQTCCQYSMHIVEENYDLAKHDFNKGIGGGITHYEYIGNPMKDKFISPEIGLIETLKAQMKKANIDWESKQFTVVVYNQSFEKGRLKEMAEKFPSDKEFLMTFRDRVVDLYDFFVRGYWYNQDFNGSLSLKTTQPTLIKDPQIKKWYNYLPYNLNETLNYKSGIIQNGQVALDVYQTLLRKMHSHSKEEQLYYDLISALLHYCKIDSWGTVILYDIIIKAIEKIEDGSIDIDVDLKNQLLNKILV